jgi:membrane associated rhomboid family serine protease
LLQVYSSYYVIQLAEGQEVADDVLSRLVNDHTAVAAGDTLRLFTCFFVADTLPQLIISLVALATVAAELESLLGYSTFWAIWCLTVLSGSVADAAFSELPITAGPAAGVAGVAAALLAHHLHNWRIEVLMQQAQTGDVPQSWLQLEQQFSWQHKQRQQQEEGEALQPSLTASINSSRSSSSSSSILGQAAGGSSTADHADEVSLVRTEIEGPVGMSFELLLPKEGKAFLTLGGTAVAVVSALKDAADTDIATDWAALIAGFLAGGFLGWMACPVYRLVLTPASSNSSSSSSSSVSYAARNVASPTASAAAAAAVNSSADPEELQPDLLLPVLRDERLPAARANAVLGFAAVLFAVLGGWLTSQGLFI